MNDIEKYNEAKQEVFEYFHDKHNLLLLSGEIDDIASIIEKYIEARSKVVNHAWDAMEKIFDKKLTIKIHAYLGISNDNVPSQYWYNSDSFEGLTIYKSEKYICDIEAEITDEKINLSGVQNAIPKVGDVGCTTDGTRVKVTKVITKPKP